MASHSEQQPEGIAESVATALAEDIGDGDRTAGLIDAHALAQATVISREPAVICGRPWFDEVFRQLDRDISIHWEVEEGQSVVADAVLCRLTGNAVKLLTGERCALNFLQTLSATATEAQRYAQAVDGTGCRILDTRKTIPGLRQAQKYAVRCGGAMNHRFGLFDGILIKENHILAAGSIRLAIARARGKSADGKSTGMPIEVEVESLDELREALRAGADILLLDNFDIDMLRAAASINRKAAKPAKLEASGNVTIDRLRSIAETGVDFVSVGALTKHIRAVDLSMRFEFVE
jgi:nicotinate-nucleotide pyrophosphorylase (carboxylating)